MRRRMPEPSQSPDAEPSPEGVDPWFEEVRLAMALNGGVSLAVWMGGCAVELDCARRAWLGPEEMGFDPGYDPGEAGATAVRRVYHGLGHALGRRLSIDVLSGASAGGVNGALLSAAMVTGRRLHPKFVRDRWLELGDLSELLREPGGDEDPTSLLKGDYFHGELLRAFRAVRGEAGGDGPQPDAAMLAAAAPPPGQAGAGDARLLPDLDVTMTDTIGAELTFTDEWELPLVAREHAPRFEFRAADDYASPALADAARASASFPVAFEPLRLAADGSGRLAGLRDTTYAIDGGLLDNAPIRAALDRIPFRRAGTLVRRYACYVNADPTQPAPPADDGPPQPEVADVLGYIVNLPRTAPFANQLYAVREATNRPLVTQTIVRRLLTLDLGALEATANALLPAYQQRRTASGIEELIEDPAAAREARGEIDTRGAQLSWIPSGGAVEAPAPGEWEWGIRPAQRILHLLLDLLRDALAATRPADESLLALRAWLAAQVDELEAMRRAVVAALGEGDEGEAAGGGEEAEGLRRLNEAVAGRSGAIYDLLAGAAARVAADGEGGAGERAAAFEPLFRPPRDEVEREQPFDPLEVFFRRVLAIEVVRRTLADDVDIDTGQRLSFVQLTPASPSPILSARPLNDPPPPAEAREKLTGVGLGHFAGFYRRAWRANDFMWGRLDAAARVVDLLLDQPPERADVDEVEATKSRAELLTEALLGPEGAEVGVAELRLIQEALADREPPADPPTTLAPPVEVYADPGSLRPTLLAAILTDLQQGAAKARERGEEPPRPRATDLPLIRALFARAAQLEVLRDELPVLVAEARADGARGSSGRPLDLGGSGDLVAMLEALRAIARTPGDSLPKRLTGEAEATSRLGMTTIARAARVGISMLEPAAPPPSKLLAFVLRPPAVLLSAIAPHDALRHFTVATGQALAAAYRRLKNLIPG